MEFNDLFDICCVCDEAINKSDVKSYLCLHPTYADEHGYVEIDPFAHTLGPFCSDKCFDGVWGVNPMRVNSSGVVCICQEREDGHAIDKGQCFVCCKTVNLKERHLSLVRIYATNIGNEKDVPLVLAIFCCLNCCNEAFEKRGLPPIPKGELS